MLEEQARRLHPSFVAVYDKAAARRFRIAIADTDIKVGSGIEGLIEAATMAETDCVVTAVSGSVGLKPTLAAIDARKRIALANKETLVCAGDIVMSRAAERGAEIVPVDSEHSAVFSALWGVTGVSSAKYSLPAPAAHSVARAGKSWRTSLRSRPVKHPNWSMGAKISVDQRHHDEQGPWNL